MSRPTALVTGAAVRVGRAIALELAASGFDLLLHHRSRPDEIEHVAEGVRAHGGQAHVVAADLGTREGRAAVVDAARTAFGALNLLVNNASVFYPVAFDRIDDDEWDRVLEVNLKAPFVLCRDLLPLLRAADATRFGAPEEQHGVVVHLCDIGADRPVSGHAHYSVSKAGLVMLVRAMAVELSPAVRTVGVSPGQVAWPESYDEATRRALARRIPLGRVGAPEDVARLVRFLTMEAHYLDGVVIPVDGGLHARY
ncbi:MAG: SDR family oxidoreductase [Alphaproteobacteria bacterium]|nr:SDR family oxidoreductase [Alphaproteobacteria bacterium]MCB9695328.1 SDR family oxidoreductase [Alphaproteobacteria bacterium]